MDKYGISVNKLRYHAKKAGAKDYVISCKGTYKVPETPYYLAILAFYFERHTLEETGQRFGITRERVRQVIKGLGYSTYTGTPTVISETLSQAKCLTFAEKFWRNVETGKPDECWEWQRGMNNVTGYGSWRDISLQKTVATHRIAYRLGHRKIPKKHVLHSCNNRRCCNPAHLREGTHQENMRDRAISPAWLAYKKRVKSGYVGKGKYPIDLVRQAVELNAMDKFSYPQLAKETGIPVRTLHSWFCKGRELPRYYQRLLKEIA